MSFRIPILLILASALVSPLRGQEETLPDPKKLYPSEATVKLRLLTKPFAKLYKKKTCKEEELINSPPAFSIFHVLAVPSKREGDLQYYEVADSKGKSLGFMLDSDVVQWKQALCLQFEHSGNREPVLMFGDKQALKDIVTGDESDRVAQAKEFYQRIGGLEENKTLPKSFPVVSMEPRRKVESKAGSYLMPIIDSQSVEMGEDDVRLLQVAIAAGRATPRGATTLTDEDYVKSANQETDAADASKALIEIVYCFDLSGSMQKYVDACRQLATKVSLEMGQKEGFQERVRFGLWGYRDHGDEGREFVVRNFTPRLQNIDTFVNTLSQAKASTTTVGDYEEDLLGGVSQAINQSWTPNSMRFIVVCGDAPGHDQANHPKNGSDKGITQLRDDANANKVSIYSIHIQDPQYVKYHSAGEQQFRGLSLNPGTGEGSYIAVQGNSEDAFSEAASGLYSVLDTFVNGPVEERRKALHKKPEADSKVPEVIANNMFRAAMVDWIGRNSTDSQTPNDLTAWISERDLVNGEQAVSAKLLVSRIQLTQLTQALKYILDAGLEGKTTGRDFFASLQSVAATAVRDPHKLKNARSLQEAGLIPDFISGLPYKSRILLLTNDLWSSWPPTQQEKFLEEVQKMISHYEDIHNTPDRWEDLDGQSSEDDKVTAISLELLP